MQLAIQIPSFLINLSAPVMNYFLALAKTMVNILFRQRSIRHNSHDNQARYDDKHDDKGDKNMYIILGSINTEDIFS